MNPLKMNENQLDQANKTLGDLARLALELVASPAENDRRKLFAIDAHLKYQAFIAAGFEKDQALFLVRDAK